MNHPRYEKIHLGCSCFRCTGKWYHYGENLDQYLKEFRRCDEKYYTKMLREISNHRVYKYRRDCRRMLSKKIRLSYKNNLKKGLDFGDQIVIISLGYTD